MEIRSGRTTARATVKVRIRIDHKVKNGFLQEYLNIPLLIFVHTAQQEPLFNMTLFRRMTASSTYFIPYVRFQLFHSTVVHALQPEFGFNE